MSAPWLLPLAGLGALLLGALLATAFWWWAAPRALLVRWSAPLRDALDAGFSDQGLQYRLRAQGDKLWARRQQAQWRENLELIHARHEACLVAEIRQLLRGGLASVTAAGAPAAVPAQSRPSRRPVAQATTPVRSASPLRPAAPAPSAAAAPTDVLTIRPAVSGTSRSTVEFPELLTDAEIDAMPPELPVVPTASRVKQAAPPSPPFRSL